MSKESKCKLITFGQINLYILLISLGSLFYAATELITLKSKKLGEENKQENTEKNRHPLIMMINYSLGLCLSFIFFIIYKICNKNNKNTNLYFFQK